MMTFAEQVSWMSLGREREGLTYIGATVLPVGWASALGFLQHHRRLAARSPLSGGDGLLGACEIRRDSVPDLWSLHGRKEFLKGSTMRVLDTLSLGFWLLRQEKAPHLCGA